MAAEIEAGMPKALAYIENILSDGRTLLGGDDVSVADCTPQSALQFARFGKVDVISTIQEYARGTSTTASVPQQKCVEVLALYKKRLRPLGLFF